MELKYKFINCDKKSFSEEEYKCLRDEIKTRVEMTYSHGFTLVAMILVFFAAIFAFCGDFYAIASSPDSIIGKSVIVDCAITYAIILFCGLPALIVYPFSVKYHDNIRQIVNIATYLRVFHEFPSLIREKKDSDKKEPEVNGWELIHCSHNIPHGNRLAIEYYIIAIASITLSAILGGVLFCCTFVLEHSTLNGETVNYLNKPANYAVLVIFGILALAYLGYLIYIAHRCRRNVKIERLFDVYGKIYTDLYIDEAIALKLYSAEKAGELKQYMEKMRKRNIIVKEELKSKRL